VRTLTVYAFWRFGEAVWALFYWKPLLLWLRQREGGQRA
jgi:hypothetical protein